MNSLDKMEKKSIKPHLIELSELKISDPLNQDRLSNIPVRLKSYLSDLTGISDLVIKQRSYLAFISYIYQTIEYKSKTNVDVRRMFTHKLEDQVALITLQCEEPNKKDDSDTAQLESIKKILRDFFKTREGLKHCEDMNLVDQIHQLKKYEGELKERWDQDMQSCLDVIAEL